MQDFKRDLNILLEKTVSQQAHNILKIKANINAEKGWINFFFFAIRWQNNKKKAIDLTLYRDVLYHGEKKKRMLP